MPVNYDDSELRELINRRLPQALERVVDITAAYLWGEIGREAPVGETGWLSGSFNVRDGQEPFTKEIHSHIEYLWWVHEGTGIYGPYKQRIKPIRAEALRFYWRKIGQVVFFKSVAGQPPNKFIDRAVKKTEPRIDEFARRAIREVVGK